jgi:hypothetical protein
MPGRMLFLNWREYINDQSNKAYEWVMKTWELPILSKNYRISMFHTPNPLLE